MTTADIAISSGIFLAINARCAPPEQKKFPCAVPDPAGADEWNLSVCVTGGDEP